MEGDIHRTVHTGLEPILAELNKNVYIIGPCPALFRGCMKLV